MDNPAEEFLFVPPTSGDAFSAVPGPESAVDAPYLHAYQQPEAAAETDPSILGQETDPTNVIPFPAAEAVRQQVVEAQAPVETDPEAIRRITERAARATQALSSLRHHTARGQQVTHPSQLWGRAA